MSALAEQIVEQIEGFLARRKLQLGIAPARVVNQILKYMALRRKGGPLTISNPKFVYPVPEVWTENDETVWQDWFSNEIHLGDWLREVFRPIFGMNTSACSWDYTCDGWRGELLNFLPFWTMRSESLVAAYDATPYDSDEEEDTDPYNAKVDPYLMDHGSRSKKTKTLN